VISKYWLCIVFDEQRQCITKKSTVVVYGIKYQPILLMCRVDRICVVGKKVYKFLRRTAEEQYYCQPQRKDDM